MSPLLTLALVAALPKGCAGLEPAQRAALADETDPGSLWSLAVSGPASGTQTLVERFRDADGVEAAVVAAALGLSRRADALRALQALPRGDSEARRFGIALGRLALGDNSISSTVAATLAEGPVELRRIGARALAFMPAVRARQLSYKLLDDPDDGVRVAIAEIHLRRASVRARRALEELAYGPLGAEAVRAMLRYELRFATQAIPRLPSEVRAEATVRAVDRGASELSLLGQSDPQIRAGAFAGAARERDMKLTTLAAIGRRNAAHFPEAKGEAAMTLLLAGDADPTGLPELDAAGIEGAIRVLTAFARPPLPALGPAEVKELVAAVEAWASAGHLTPDGRSRVLEALARLDPRAGVDLARAGLEAPESAAAAASVLAEAGTRADVGALLASAGAHQGWARAEALRAAAEICER